VKKLARRILHIFGVDIVRCAATSSGKSIRTRALIYFKTVTGNYYLPRDARGDLIAAAIKAGRIYDEEILAAARKHINSGTVVLDVGANFGQMSILFSDIVGETGRVYSFEADDFIFEILTKNIAANDRERRIIPVFGAVHSVAGQILHFPVQDFVRFQTYGSYGIDYNGKAGRSVGSITIDSLEISEPISFMKIDVQGGDLHAMRGAVKTIEKNRMPILFEYEYQFEAEYNLSFQEYVDFVAQIGYRFENVIKGNNFLIVPR
jgi:FkbM family methyltransferase